MRCSTTASTTRTPA
ncbi:Protein of unknown function [Pyronema omphalodes CBS 100304]|uniref:Uncharacterized protein n=1 Tax=Pyronema omphalodes (strain CBS 100304) TaxID=1076935 RepID=U4LQL2_PYROM|nr:Protein of unknown function [Pyronema omphalodes CBS 100304]